MQLLKNLKYISFFAFMALFAATVTSCSDDDDDDDDDPIEEATGPTGSVDVNDQTIDNSVFIESVEMSDPGFIIIHRDDPDGEGPVVPEDISEAEDVAAGTTNSVEVELHPTAEVAQGENLWVMLHTDDGVAQEYEFDGTNGLDKPITNANGSIVMTRIANLNEAGDPTGTVEVSTHQVDNTVTVDMIHVSEPGFVVVYRDGGGEPEIPGIISEAKYLEAGAHADVEIQLNEGEEVGVETLWIMIHRDTGEEGVYEFDGISQNDSPFYRFNGEDMVTESFLAL